MTLHYPPLPVEKQYGGDFPKVPVRGVPSEKQSQTVMVAHRALQPDNADSAEAFAEPVKLEFGVIDLCLQGGAERSWAYDDGAQPNDEEMTRLEARADFCFVPGVDDGGLKIAWTIYGKSNIASAKLELFARAQAEPVWKHGWGGAWGTEDAPIGDLPAEPGKLPTLFRGELPWSSVKLENEELFPHGVLTTAHSPYQLRLTVSGKTAEDDPAERDEFAYPMVGWTYAHILVHSLRVQGGDREWLSTKRDDADDASRKALVGTRETEDGVKDFGFEGEILAPLLREDAKFSGDARHSVPLYTPETKKNEEAPKPLAPRVPLLATPLLRKLDGEPTEEGVKTVCAGQTFLWHAVEEPQDPPVAAPADERSFLEQTPKGESPGALPFEVSHAATRTSAALATTDDKGQVGVFFQPPARDASWAMRVYPFFAPELDGADELDPSALAEWSKDGASWALGTFDVAQVRLELLKGSTQGPGSEIEGKGLTDLEEADFAPVMPLHCLEVFAETQVWPASGHLLVVRLHPGSMPPEFTLSMLWKGDEETRQPLKVVPQPPNADGFCEVPFVLFTGDEPRGGSLSLPCGLVGVGLPEREGVLPDSIEFSAKGLAPQVLKLAQVIPQLPLASASDEGRP
jgi:hypothetical protein